MDLSGFIDKAKDAAREQAAEHAAKQMLKSEDKGNMVSMFCDKGVDHCAELCKDKLDDMFDGEQKEEDDKKEDGGGFPGANLLSGIKSSPFGNILG